MFSYFINFLNYLLGKSQDEDSDEEKENFLAEQLLDLEVQGEKETVNSVSTPVREAPRNAVCFQKTGLVTYCGESCILIDGMIYYDMSGCSLNVNVNDKVLYLGYKDTNDSIVVVRILQNQGLFWGDEEESEESNFNVIEHVIIGQVSHRQDRSVFITESDLKFNLDEVEGTFVPIKGDWLEMKCSMQQDENKPTDVSTNQVLKVISFNPIRTKIKSAVVTEWFGTDGVCDRQIYFNNSALVNGYQPSVGTKVLIFDNYILKYCSKNVTLCHKPLKFMTTKFLMDRVVKNEIVYKFLKKGLDDLNRQVLVEAIESTQDRCTWRAIKLIVIESGSPKKSQAELPDEEQISLKLETEKKIEITYPIKFEQVNIDSTEKIILNITNRSNETYILNKWMVLGKKKDSQVNIKPFVSKQIRLNPEQTFTFTITCHPKFLGNSKEYFVILFKGFQFKRFICVNVVDRYNIVNDGVNDVQSARKINNVESMKTIRNRDNSFISGERPYKSPAFISVRIGQFPIPDKIWSVVLGDSEQALYTNEFHKILSLIENNFPCLAQELNITNYIDKWHTLLYMEEVQINLSMRSYDQSKVYLTHCDEYLSIEIPGLAEKRPSLMKGDRVIVKDIWSSDAPKYEGFVHLIRGTLVLMKFCSQFHESYGGSDVSIEFHCTRTAIRRSHHAINVALSALGPDILFPSRLLIKPQQIPDEKLGVIEWFNHNLNKCQKNAVINILKGECRPMPYIIFGPPGSGKTVTVIETILQILTWLPESRILVATPSNSASNLLTERLIQYKGRFTGSIVRLIAAYLVESDSIPDMIKPYCATLDISAENSSRNKHFVKDNINMNCSKSLIGRHRVTIATCYCIGALKHIDLPRGHFTHIIVDEAGQATEPEIMLPLTFADKEHGQIILAGDPMQLGPVVTSKYCKEYGLDESFLCRLLDRFPYLKDYEAYVDGFDKRLVTKLNDNYRSLVEVIRLPNEMFYDGTLVAKIDKSLPWTSKFINVTSDIFDTPCSDGGIFVYGIKGANLRAEDSPSWYNPQEASMVALTTCKLYKRNVNAKEIGIITPYIAQVKYFRVIFDSMGLPQPKIGTVEDFQGQERAITFISTVRSTASVIEEDNKHYLGFLNNPKRLNVALTRAQVATILFCNPHLLSIDPLWNKVIADAVLNEKYMGCDLPSDYVSDNNISE